MMGGDEAMETYEICMGANLTCMNDLMNRMGETEVYIIKKTKLYFIDGGKPHLRERPYEYKLYCINKVTKIKHFV